MQTKININNHAVHHSVCAIEIKFHIHIATRTFLISYFTQVLMFIMHTSWISSSFCMHAWEVLECVDVYVFLSIAMPAATFLVNPRHMCCRVTVIILHVCVCVCVYLLPWNLLPTSFLRRKLSFIWFFMVFSTFYRVAFPANALFKSSGIICRSPLP